MKVVISHAGRKRQIDGPFRICGSSEDLMRIASLIVEKCNPRSVIHDGKIQQVKSAYGWVEIFDAPETAPHVTSSKPEPW